MITNSRICFPLTPVVSAKLDSSPRNGWSYCLKHVNIITIKQQSHLGKYRSVCYRKEVNYETKTRLWNESLQFDLHLLLCSLICWILEANQVYRQARTIYAHYHVDKPASIDCLFHSQNTTKRRKTNINTCKAV